MANQWRSPTRAGHSANDPAKGLGEKHRQILESSIEHLHGPREISYAEDELAVLCLVRDGRPYVETFIEHYRSLGAKHIVFLDNGSTDGTVDALLEYESITVLRTTLPYKEYKYLFKQYLHARFGENRWSLYVDIDELFEYPHSDVLPIGSLLDYLRGKSYTAVVSHMLDMFPEEPLTGKVSSGSELLKEKHTYYDVSDIIRRDLNETPRVEGNTTDTDELETFSGGIRRILFGVRPALTKFPLIFSDGEITPSADSSHIVRGARIADISCVLLHYKFLERFHEQAARAVEEKNYFGDSQEYKKYLEVLEKTPELRIKQETSRKLTNTDDLIESGFLLVSEDFTSIVDAKDETDILEESGSPEPAAKLVEARRREREKLRKVGHLDRQAARQTLRFNRLDRDLKQLRNSRQQGAAAKTREEEHTAKSGDSFSDELRPLFVGGCQRSGTTAFVDYINEHEAVLVCQERYKKIPKAAITADLFTFERIMDYRESETNKPWNLDKYISQHREMLDAKDPASLRWIGDKNPTFVKNMEVLQNNHPGARFVMLYRPVEEVVESWEARAKNPNDHWREDMDFRKAVREWNLSMAALKEFISGQSLPRVLILGYHDFFHRNEECAPLVADFLGIEVGEDVRRRWAAKSGTFEESRRTKENLSEEQKMFIRENADRESEAWILERIESQWSRPELYISEAADPASGALSEMEARAWRLERRVRQLSKQSSGHGRLIARNRDLERELEALRSSKALRIARLLGRIRRVAKSRIKSIAPGKGRERS